MNPEPSELKRVPRGGSEPLRGRDKFRDVFLSGARIRGKHVGCAYLVRKTPNASSTRVAFVIRNSSMTAVARNRFKRLMREAYRRMNRPESNMQGKNVDMIFIAQPSERYTPSFVEVHAEIETLVEAVSASLAEGQ